MTDKGNGFDHPLVFVIDECCVFNRGVSEILHSINIPTTICLDSLTACTMALTELSEPGNPKSTLAICGPTLEERSLFMFLRWCHVTFHTRALVISTLADDRNYYLDVAANHAAACLSHKLPCEDLSQAISTIIQGHTLFTTDDLEIAFHSIHITPSEQTVLEKMADELTYSAIASCLNLSLKTVNTHVSHILGKFAAQTREAAVARAYRRGLL